MNCARTFTPIMATMGVMFGLAGIGSLVDQRPLFAGIFFILSTYCAIAAWCCPRIRGWR